MVEAERATGRSSRQLLRYAKGEEMGVSVVTALAELADVPADWIVGGIPRGSAAQSQRIRDLRAKLEESAMQGPEVLLPRYDQRASAGAGVLVVDDNPAEFFTVGKGWLRRNLPPWAPANAVVGILEGSGDSMEPTIRDGDLVMVVQDVDWRIVERGGIFVFTLDHDRLLLKRLQVLQNGDLRIISDNRAYEPNEIIPRDQVDDRVIVHGQVFFVGGKPRSY